MDVQCSQVQILSCFALQGLFKEGIFKNNVNQLFCSSIYFHIFLFTEIFFLDNVHFTGDLFSKISLSRKNKTFAKTN